MLENEIWRKLDADSVSQCGSSPSFRQYKCTILWLVMVTALILRSYDGKEEGKILCNIYQTVKNEAEHFVGGF